MHQLKSTPLYFDIKVESVIHFDNLTEYHHHLNWPAPEHPLISVITLEDAYANMEEIEHTLSTAFYSIKYRDIMEGDFGYGRTKYDCSSGNMIFTAPNQVLQFTKAPNQSCGLVLLIHEDYFNGTELARKISTYPFFSYSVNEALHLSPKEQKVIQSIFENIHTEYLNNQDEFSKELIISHLDSLLKYANRFYKRQFLNRRDMNVDLSYRFRAALIEYFDSDRLEVDGSPNIERIANQLSVSPRYLSDALKSETGKTAIEHLHLFLIDEAKNRLLEPGITVTEVAYQLGFEYPQYFSRLFKRKLGKSPKAFISEHQRAELN